MKDAMTNDQPKGVSHAETMALVFALYMSFLVLGFLLGKQGRTYEESRGLKASW